MLNQDQIKDAWECKISAEARALYFADLARLYSERKQWITGISFFLSSGAAVVLLAKLPAFIAVICSVLVAVLNAYVVSVNLDARIRTVTKLQLGWDRISKQYRQLWNHAYTDEAEADLYRIQDREVELSESAATDAPYDSKRMSFWMDKVLAQNGCATT